MAQQRHIKAMNPKDIRPIQEILTKAGDLLDQKDYPAFKETLAQAEALQADHPGVIHLKGLYHFDKKEIPRAFELMAQAAQALPKSASVKHNLAAVQISLGHFSAAEQNLMRALTIKPNYAEACHTLAGIHKFTVDDPVIGHMKKLAKTVKFTRKDASFLCFALAKAYDDSGQVEQVWPVLEQANSHMDSTYEKEREETSCARARAVFTAPFIAQRSAYGHPSRAPIFIVGMPRSGTTLLESILAEHPQVYAAGEQPIIPAMGRTLAERKDLPPERAGHANAIEALDPAEHFGAGQGYLNALRNTHPKWFDYCVDKLPDNSLNLGLIACTLPGARILHIMRHPLDIMFSIYMQRFTAVPYGFRVEDIVSHWRSYQEMMAHWRNVLPKGMLLELRYENLVQDKDFARSYLWQHLGLTEQVDHVEGRSKSLTQHTASRWQVKQPVYQSSREKFRKYETQMAPFITAIGGMAEIDADVARQDALCALRHASTISEHDGS